MLMLSIIMVAFANFFYIIDSNTSDDHSYVSSNVGIPLVDSILSMYLIALGEFGTDGFSEGPNVIVAWVFFVMATAMVLIVFMNMLIVIVSDTFAHVESLKEELALGEQLKLIQDYIFLIDLNEEFNTKKYIIRLYPDSTV